MNSLQELNTFGSQSLTVEDAGNGSVVLDRYPFQIKDQAITINSQTVNVSIPYKILSIINYGSASARLRITLKTTGTPALVSTLSFGSLPSYMSVSHIDNVYTVVGLRQASDWDAIKNFTWNLASNYASCKNWYLLIELVWYENGVLTTVGYSQYDLRYYYISQMTSQAEFNLISGAVRHVSMTVSSRANLECAEGDTRLKTSGATLSASSSVYCNAIEFQRVNTIEVTSTMSIIPTEFPKFTFLSNQKNQFALPEIEDWGNGTDTYSYMVIVTSGQGTIGTLTSSSSTWLETGTRSYINNKLANLYFYPTKDRTTNATITIILSKNNQEIFTRYDTIYYAGSGAIATTVYTFTSNGTWTSNLEEYKYGQIDMLLVGGGGGGGSGGGGGGSVREVFNQTINSNTYSITIGVGGSGSTTNYVALGSSGTYNGGNGTASQISLNGTVIYGAIGGTGGKRIMTYAPSGYTYDFSGGNSYDYTTNSTIVGNSLITTTYPHESANGASSSGSNGSGKTSVIYPGIFGSGGGGGYQDTATSPYVPYQGGGSGYGHGGGGGVAMPQTTQTLPEIIEDTISGLPGGSGLVVIRAHA